MRKKLIRILARNTVCLYFKNKHIYEFGTIYLIRGIYAFYFSHNARAFWSFRIIFAPFLLTSCINHLNNIYEKICVRAGNFMCWTLIGIRLDIQFRSLSTTFSISWHVYLYLNSLYLQTHIRTQTCICII